MAEGFLETAYGALDTVAVRALYDDWSDSYEAELTRNGYATPDRSAAALAGHVVDPAAPVLDFGCGTELSGLALRRAGFTTIDGLDVSHGMLAQARQKGIYRALDRIAEDAPLPFAPGTYAAIAAVGVIGAGAAPVAVLHQLMLGLWKGGRLVFSLDDHALADPCFEAALNEWLDCGAARLLFREHGPHLPGIGLGATVYVIEKT